MIYAVASLAISNPSSLLAYREVAGPALAKHGGKVESSVREYTIIDGAPNAPDMMVVLSFPDREAAIAWANDPELSDVHDLRRGAGESNILLLG